MPEGKVEGDVAVVERDVAVEEDAFVEEAQVELDKLEVEEVPILPGNIETPGLVELEPERKVLKTSESNETLLFMSPIKHPYENVFVCPDCSSMS